MKLSLILIILIVTIYKIIWDLIQITINPILQLIILTLMIIVSIFIHQFFKFNLFVIVVKTKFIWPHKAQNVFLTGTFTSWVNHQLMT